MTVSPGNPSDGFEMVIEDSLDNVASGIICAFTDPTKDRAKTTPTNLLKHTAAFFISEIFSNRIKKLSRFTSGTDE